MTLLELGSLAASPPAATALAWAQAVAGDTVVTVQASSTGMQRWVDILTSVASMVIAIALIAIAIPLVPAAWNSRKLYRRINRLVERVQQDINPILQHAHAVADNVNYISTSVRMDVEKFKSTIDRTQQRLDHAAAQAEERINQLNALLQVVQEEAEDLFVDAASTVRGVQAGSRALRDFPSAEAEAAEAEAAAEEWDVPIEFEDEYGPGRGIPPRHQP